MSQHGGGMQYLPNKGGLVSYGGTNFIQEYAPSGKLVNALQIQGGSSFRAYKYAGWNATPAASPDVASFYDSGTGMTSVYMSWNGATNVASWRVGGKTAPKSGFETLVELTGYVPIVQARALGKQGGVLGTSTLVSTQGGLI